MNMGLLDRVRKGIAEPPRVDDKGIPTFKVTMMGGSSAGKSVYMHALFQLLKYSLPGDDGPLGGHNINGAADDVPTQIQRDKEIEKFTWKRIIEENKELVFPRGNEVTEQWVFSLTHGNDVICKFEWIDYRGALIGDLDASSPEAEELREIIEKSDGLILFVDPISLFYYEDDQQKMIKSGITALRDTIMSLTIQLSKLDKSVSIILAKSDSDLISQDVAQPGLIRGDQENQLNKAYAGLIKAYLKHGKVLNNVLLNAGWPTAITPVGSLGHSRTKTTLVPGEGMSLDDCLYAPNPGENVPDGNNVGKYFDPIKPPNQEVEFIPVSRGNIFPRPVNAFSPVLWVLDNLLRNANAGDLNVAGTTRGNLLQRVLNTVGEFIGVSDPEKPEPLENIEDPSTGKVVKQSTIVPLSSLYPGNEVR